MIAVSIFAEINRAGVAIIKIAHSEETAKTADAGVSSTEIVVIAYKWLIVTLSVNAVINGAYITVIHSAKRIKDANPVFASVIRAGIIIVANLRDENTLTVCARIICASIRIITNHLLKYANAVFAGIRSA